MKLSIFRQASLMSLIVRSPFRRQARAALRLFAFLRMGRECVSAVIVFSAQDTR